MMTERVAYEAPTVVQLGAVRDFTLALNALGVCVQITDPITGEVEVDNACGS